MADHRMRLVCFFQLLDFLRCELDRQGCHSILQVVCLGSTDYRGGDDWFG